MKLKIKNAGEVGKLIDATIASAVHTTETAHAAAIQSLAHMCLHGDTTLMSRLMDGLTNTSFNVKGLRFWLTTFAPVTARAGTLTLMDKKGDAYAKLIERNTAKYGEGEEGVGKRLFWVDAADENPFYKMEEVTDDQNGAIPTQGTRTLIKLVTGLPGRVDKLVEDHKFGGDVALAESFAKAMRNAAIAWEDENKSVIRLEDARIDAIKKGLKTDAAAGVNMPDVEPGNAAEAPKVEVGGLKVDDEQVTDPLLITKTGTEG